MGLAVDDDPIRKLARSVLSALSERQPVVEAEEVEASVLGSVLDDEDDVLEAVDHLIGQTIELVDDEFFEGAASISIVFSLLPADGRPRRCCQCRKTRSPATAMNSTPKTEFSVRCPRTSA